MDEFAHIPLFQSLNADCQRALSRLTAEFPFTFQERKQLCDFTADFSSWEAGLPWEGVADSFWERAKATPDSLHRKALFAEIEKAYRRVQEDVTKSYDGFPSRPAKAEAESAAGAAKMVDAAAEAEAAAGSAAAESAACAAGAAAAKSSAAKTIAESAAAGSAAAESAATGAAVAAVAAGAAGAAAAGGKGTPAGEPMLQAGSDAAIGSDGSDARLSAQWVDPKGSIMGRCPVASDKTRCCQLYTLDCVWQCGFDCSYCSIQSFYSHHTVRFVSELPRRLAEIPLDPSKRYHIGTGQSSDSLMWGNAHGLLDHLCDFAEAHPNVILEFKSKSSATAYFEERVTDGRGIPKNILFTWSLNTPIVARVEERGAASVEKRLSAARTIADLGAPVGFHFHPMVLYDRWKADYRALVRQVTDRFRPSEVMTLSIGTLTFIKPVIRRIRERQAKTRILQMPMEEIAGKISYPYEKKEELFSWLYQSFPPEWQREVFFYLCMEDPRLWNAVFGREYPDNDAFEQAMLNHYFDFIRR